jgi:hypothetical protein
MVAGLSGIKPLSTAWESPPFHDLMLVHALEKNDPLDGAEDEFPAWTIPPLPAGRLSSKY